MCARPGRSDGRRFVRASAVPAQNPRADDPARPQVQTFEMVLGRALETAGRNFATRAAEIAPQLTALPTGENPQVTGVAVRDLNLFVFNVQVPGSEFDPVCHEPDGESSAVCRSARRRRSRSL